MVGRMFLGRFETIRLLGEGGMGRVYLANDIKLGRQVVVKVMHDHIASDSNFRKRFEREKEAMVRFQHPYVVTLHDASLDDPEGPCIVMEYIRGVTLDVMLQKNTRLSAPRVGRLLSQLCEALFAAHQKGIVHRDLKPANLMIVDADSPYEILKVMDFGLVKLVAGSAKALNQDTVTNNDFAVGTPGYISPEQVRGDPMDHRSDLYSVGVILFELLTGRLPFVGAETMDVLLAHATQPPPRFEDVGASFWVPPSIEAVVTACLAKDANERPGTARELAEMYEAALAQERSPEVPSPAIVMDALMGPGHITPLPQPAAAFPHHEFDPQMVTCQLQAWMPDTIANYKLQGFVDDVGGQVTESKPGRIRVRLGGRGSVYFVPGTGPLSWIGLGGRMPAIEMELLLERDPSQTSLLWISVQMRPAFGKGGLLSEAFRERCKQVFCDLRGYLMGQGVSIGQ
jgi:serine/threonine-protein kinase